MKRERGDKEEGVVNREVMVPMKVKADEEELRAVRVRAKGKFGIASHLSWEFSGVNVPQLRRPALIALVAQPKASSTSSKSESVLWTIA